MSAAGRALVRSIWAAMDPAPLHHTLCSVLEGVVGVRRELGGGLGWASPLNVPKATYDHSCY